MAKSDSNLSPIHPPRALPEEVGTPTFGYRDVSYFLTEANGPWGSLAWTHDRIGNRLTETRDGATEVYAYLTNGTCNPMLASCNTPLLTGISGPAFGSRGYSHGPAGHLEEVDRGGNVVHFSYDEEGRMGEALRTDDTGTDVFGTATFSYDGRSFLRETVEAETGATAEPLYGSDGLLHALTRRASGADPEETTHLFYFAGRPVAQVVADGSGDTWWYFTTDHLGTPAVATDETGDELWAGPFEPFGQDPAAGLPSGALKSGVFLRFPGQWEDESWLEATRGAEPFQNVHRWYLSFIGRYGKPDPAGLSAGINLYNYAVANPLLYFDPLGEKVCRCDRRLATPVMSLNLVLDPAAHHSYIQIVPDSRECGGLDGVAWGFQAAGGGRVLPERTPAFNPQIRCEEVPCIDEHKLLQNIVRDMKSPPYTYQAVCRIGRGWNERNCQGWADDILDRSRKQPCCD